MYASTEKQEDTIARSSELRCPKWENDRHEPLSGEKHVVVDRHRVEREVLALRVPSVADQTDEPNGRSSKMRPT